MTTLPSLPSPRRARGLRIDAAGVGTLMAFGSMTTVQLGIALSVPLIDRLGALGTAGLRLGWAGVLLLVLVRPRLQDFTRRALLSAVLLGVVTAGLMGFFMLAVARLPLGTASALEFLGPLAVSLLGPGRGRRIWAVAAGLGVLLLTEPWHGGVDALGVGWALAAAACWAAYILLTQRVGDEVTGLAGLAVSMPVAGLIGGLVAAPGIVHSVTPGLLFAMLGLAALSAVLPFALEFLALRRLTTAAFGTLMGLEPAIALVVGVLVLGQVPGLLSAAGVVLVVIAGVGASRGGARDDAPAETEAPKAPSGARGTARPATLCEAA